MPTAPNTTDILLDPELIREQYPKGKAGDIDAAAAAGNIAALNRLRQKAIEEPDDTSLDFLRPYAEGDLTRELFQLIMSRTEMDYRNSTLMHKVSAGRKQTDTHRLLELSRNLRLGQYKDV